MALKVNTAEGQANATVLTAGNSGGGSGDAFSAISGAPVFSTAQHMHGAQSYLMNEATALAYCSWTGYTATSGATRVWLYLVSTVSSTQDLVAIRNSVPANVCKLQITNLNKIRVTDSADATLTTFASTLSAATWYRLELRAVPGVDTTHGTIEAAYYLGDSGTPVDTAYSSTTVNAGITNITQFRIGKITSGVALNAHFDDLAVNDGATALMGTGIATVTGVAATVTTAAGVPAVNVGISLPAVAATVTTAAAAPTLATGVRIAAVAATVTAAAPAPVVTATSPNASITAVAATVSTAAGVPAVATGVSIPAVAATVTEAAVASAAPTTGAVATVPAATVTAAAQPPVPRGASTLTAPAATVTTAAQAPTTVRGAASVQAVAGSASAFSPPPNVTASAAGSQSRLTETSVMTTGGSQSRLTDVSVTSVSGSASRLTAASVRVGAPAEVDAGGIQILDPWQTAVLSPTVVTPDVVPTSAVWTLETTTVAGVEPAVTPLGLGASYDTPATLHGVTFLWKVAVQIAGSPDAVDYVQHIIRGHGGLWSIGPGGIYRPDQTFVY